MLKKIPGFTVSNDGQLTVNGKKIDRLFVDGDEFFGSDPTIATKNLNAKAIDQIKVYEQEGISIDSGEKTENILDLTLKEDAKRGHFGKVGIATDFTQYHLGELLYNRFSNNRKISVYFLNSSVPKSNFTKKEIEQYGLENEVNYSNNDDGTVNISVNNPVETLGLPQTTSGGFYYSETFGKKNKLKIHLTIRTAELIF